MQVDMVSIGYNAEELSTEKMKDENGKVVLDESGEEQPVPDTGISFPVQRRLQDLHGLQRRLGHHARSRPRTSSAASAISKPCEQKVIIPQCESICRNNGSKLGAVELLVGDSRQKFQADVDAAFNKVLKEKNISLLYGLVRHIYIPKEVREPIQKGYVADELALTRNQETTTAKMEAHLREAEQTVLLEAARITEGTKKLVAETEGHRPEGSRHHRRRNGEEGRRHRPASAPKSTPKRPWPWARPKTPPSGCSRKPGPNCSNWPSRPSATRRPTPSGNSPRALPENIELKMIYSGSGNAVDRSEGPRRRC